MATYDRTYYGNATDIALAKQTGLSGNFIDVSSYGDGSKYQDLLHAYRTGANPIILGGAGATGGINDSIYKQLTDNGASIQRIGGKDRYEVQNNFRNYATDLAKQKTLYDTEQTKKNLIEQGKSQVNQLYDQQKISQLDQLKAQRDKAIGGINQQKSQVAPQYQQARNQADVVSQQNVQRLRELMAANGLTASGENVSAQVAQNNTRQSSLNQLRLQEQQVMNQYDQQITDLNNPAEEQAIISAIEAERTKALIDAQNRAEEMAYQQSRDTIADDRYSQERNAEIAWRQYTFNNMSATEKAQLEWTKQQYGEDAAWRMYQLKYEGELANAQNQTALNLYTNSGFLTP